MTEQLITLLYTFGLMYFEKEICPNPHVQFIQKLSLRFKFEASLSQTLLVQWQQRLFEHVGMFLQVKAYNWKNKTKQKNNKNPSSSSPNKEDSPEPGQVNQVHEDHVAYCLSFACFILEWISRVMISTWLLTIMPLSKLA